MGAPGSQGPPLPLASPSDLPPPTNPDIAHSAKALGVTYEQLFDACTEAYHGNTGPVYPGSLSFEDEDQLERAIRGDRPLPGPGKIYFDPWSTWDAWAEESGVVFPEEGSSCCPEVEHPSEPIFSYPDPSAK